MEPSAGIELPPPIHPETPHSYPEQFPATSGEVSGNETPLEKPTPKVEAQEIPPNPPVLSVAPDDTSNVTTNNLADKLATILPSTASDEEKIEPGWVRAAEVIIAQTQKDPYNQGKAIENVRSKYRQTRSGTTMPEAA